ncbi:MAG: SdpI family protein [Deltaproteobacteria bacterium]|nr:SdpI family protein [Deltaproteobacteria bacterium]
MTKDPAVQAKWVNVMITIAGLILIGLSVPLIMEKVGPNGWYGFRTDKTLANPVTWYVANREAAYGMLAAGVIVVITALVMRGRAESMGFKKSNRIQVAVFLGCIVAMAGYGFLIVSRL